MGLNEHYTTPLYLSLTLGIVTPYLDSCLTPSPTSAIVILVHHSHRFNDVHTRPAFELDEFEGKWGDLTGMQKIASGYPSSI